MSNDDGDRRAQILDAALTVFSTQGYHKASIKAIAKAAQVKSSALIYWYFDDKAALLRAVIEERSPLRHLPVFDESLVAAAMTLPPETLLTQLMHGVLGLQDDPNSVAMMRLYLSEAVRNPDIGEGLGAFQTKVLDFLTGYLRHQIEAGHLREHDVESSARNLMGMIIINILGNQAFPHAGAGFPDRDRYVTQTVALFLKGLANESS
jgi:AcrR family transcriptional regulator